MAGLKLSRRRYLEEIPPLVPWVYVSSRRHKWWRRFVPDKKIWATQWTFHLRVWMSTQVTANGTRKA